MYTGIIIFILEIKWLRIREVYYFAQISNRVKIPPNPKAHIISLACRSIHHEHLKGGDLYWEMVIWPVIFNLDTSFLSNYFAIPSLTWSLLTLQNREQILV